LQKSSAECNCHLVFQAALPIYGEKEIDKGETLKTSNKKEVELQTAEKKNYCYQSCHFMRN